MSANFPVVLKGKSDHVLLLEKVCFEILWLCLYSHQKESSEVAVEHSVYSLGQIWTHGQLLDC